MSGFVKRHLSTIAVAMVTAMVTAGIPATAAIINATKLNGYRANQLIRVAEASDTGVVLDGPSGYAPLAEAPIRAPRDGYLVMTASADASYQSPVTAPNAHCRLSIDLSVSPVLIWASDRYLTFSDSAGTRHKTCATNAAWPVSKGLHVVTLEGSLSHVNLDFRSPTLQVLFVPFGANGKVPAPISGPGAPVA